MQGAGVLVQPEASQLRQPAQVPDLRQVPDLVLAHVQLPKATARREVDQAADLVDTGIYASPILLLTGRPQPQNRFR